VSLDKNKYLLSALNWLLQHPLSFLSMAPWEKAN
jgi:hypothetical protein